MDTVWWPGIDQDIENTEPVPSVRQISHRHTYYHGPVVQEFMLISWVHLGLILV